MADDVSRASITYERETELIRESQKTNPLAKKKHEFKAAHWTHKNGHPRCRICGDEERIGGMCDGIDDMSKAKKKELSREYLEETVTLARKYLPPWLWKRLRTIARGKAGGRRSAAANREARLTAAGLAEQVTKQEVVFTEWPKMTARAIKEPGLGHGIETRFAWSWAEKQDRSFVAEPYYRGRRALFVKHGDEVKVPDGFEDVGEQLKKFDRDVVLCAVILDVPEEYGKVAAVYDILAYGDSTPVAYGLRRSYMRAVLNRLPDKMRLVSMRVVANGEKLPKSLATEAAELVAGQNPDVVGGVILKSQEAIEGKPAERALVIQQGPFRIQTVVFPKARWTATTARQWLKDHDFRSTGMDETPNSYRFRQRDPDDFERIRPVCLSPANAAPRLSECRILAFGGPTGEASSVRREAEIINKAEELQQVTGVVMEPNERDAHGDVTSRDEIRQAAHQFATDYRKGRTKLRMQHDRDLTDDDAVLVENFVTPEPMTIGGQPIKAGTWIQTWQILDKALWRRVKLGLLTGFSIGGLARKV